MFTIAKTVQSPLMQGIVRDHDDHSEAAPMRSTGNLVLLEGYDETDAHNWAVEFRCDVCQQLVRSGYADLHDNVRAALKQLGIIQN